MSQPFNKEQLAYLQQLMTNRNKSLRHEVSDHLDNSLPVKKLENGAAGQVVSTDGNTTYWSDAIADIWASRAGNVVAHAGSTAPDGALLCYGQAVSRTTYAKLFAAIGTSFGSGDGVTTFNVPDLRGRVWAGLDNMGGSDAGWLSWANTMGTVGGAQTHQLTAAESGLPAHYHTLLSENGGAGVYYGGWGGRESFLRANTANYTQAPATSTVGGSSASSAHNNMQPTILGNYIIWTGERP